jgi:hypothetical protein
LRPDWYIWESLEHQWGGLLVSRSPVLGRMCRRSCVCAVRKHAVGFC